MTLITSAPLLIYNFETHPDAPATQLTLESWSIIVVQRDSWERKHYNSPPRPRNQDVYFQFAERNVQLRRPSPSVVYPLPSGVSCSSVESCSSMETSSSSIWNHKHCIIGQPQPNVMDFLADLCPRRSPQDSRAFCGPYKTAALSKVSLAWRDVINEDQTWQGSCEGISGYVSSTPLFPLRCSENPKTTK
jgi:hypothetical protein